MIVVIDTNTLLQARAASNPLHPILVAWFHGQLIWAISTEILLEYQEIISQRGGTAGWSRLAAILDVVSELRPSTLMKVSPAFRHRLITADPDDAIADCAIAADADLVITSDHHFDALIGSGYKLRPVTPEEFIRRCLSGG